MGLILDSSILISVERRKQNVWDLLEYLDTSHQEPQTALSVISVIELSHGIYRAKSSTDRQQRQGFVEELCLAVPIQPVTLEIARLAGKLVGEQAAKGITFPTADLLIGATALHLGYAVATHNVRHFRLIPGLTVLQL